MRRKTLLTFIVVLGIITGSCLGISDASPNKIIDIELSELTPAARKQVECLAENIYHEAGHEPEAGRIAVGLVTMNRLTDNRFPKSICGVVQQKTKIDLIGDSKVVCQFSWYCMKVAINRASEAYQNSLRNALHVYANYEMMDDFTKGSLYYHADYVNPRWRNVRKTVVIGRHIFYKEGNQYDAKAKPTTERRGVSSLVFSFNGRDNSIDM